MSGESLLIYICNFHVLSHFFLIYTCKLHWNVQVTTDAVDSSYQGRELRVDLLPQSPDDAYIIRMASTAHFLSSGMTRFYISMHDKVFGSTPDLSQLNPNLHPGPVTT